MTPGHDHVRPSLEAASDRNSPSRATPPAKATPPQPSSKPTATGEEKKPWLEKWIETEEEEAFNLPFTD